MSGSRPISRIWWTARGVRPSPQVLSRGNALRSSTQTSWPALASQNPAALPAGPPPVTRTSWRAGVMRTKPRACPGGSAPEVGLGDARGLGHRAQPRLGEGLLAPGHREDVLVVGVGLAHVGAGQLALVQDH